MLVIMLIVDSCGELLVVVFVMVIVEVVMVILEAVMVIVVFVMVIVGGCSAVVIVRVYSEVMTGPHTLDNSLICRDMTEGLRQTLTDSTIVD